MENQDKKNDSTNGTNQNILLLPAGKVDSDVQPESPYKADVYEAYCLWKSLPALLKNPPPQRDKATKQFIKPDAKEFAQLQGIEDEDLLELIGISSQAEFRERFNVSRDTLARWNKLILDRAPFEDTKKWAKHLINNLVMGIYSHAMKSGNPFNSKLFLQIVGDFSEKATVEHKLTKIESVEFIEIPNGQTPTKAE